MHGCLKLFLETVCTYSCTSGSDGCSDESGGDVTLSVEPTVQGGTDGGGPSGGLTTGGDCVCLTASSPTGDGFVVIVIQAILLCNTNTITLTSNIILITTALAQNTTKAVNKQL